MSVINSSNEKVSQLQNLEHTTQNYSMQKQQLQTRVLEIESALEELDMDTDSYKIVGNIMVKSDSKKLKEDLDSEKEKNQIRITTIEKQMNVIQEKMQKLQQEVMTELQESKK